MPSIKQSGIFAWLFGGRHRDRDRENNFLDSVEVLETASEIHVHLRRTGRPIQDADILIAATAITHNLTLVSNDSDLQIKVTRQSGFGTFNVAGYWRRNYGKKKWKEPWYLLTNLSSLKQAKASYQARFGIEAMFKDCQTGGYNLEGYHGNEPRLINLILLIALAYTAVAILGKQIKNSGFQKYISRLTEVGRIYICRGYKYIEEIIKLLPQKPEPVLLTQIQERISSLGRIHQPTPVRN